MGKRKSKRRGQRNKPYLNNPQKPVKQQNASATPQASEAMSGGSKTYYVHGPMGLERQQQPNGSWVFPIQDGLGSVRGVVGNNWPDLDVLESRQYDPYGALFDAHGASQTPYGFAGEMADPNGLVYLRARYYNPGMGMFVSPDPLEGNVRDPMSLNPYAYAHGNPANRTDPSGYAPLNPQAINNLIQSDPRRFAEMMNSGCFPQLQQPPQPSPQDLCEGITDSSIYAQCVAFPTAWLREPIDQGDCTIDSRGFDDRWGTGLRSRDINPPGMPPGNYPVVSPGRAEVMIVSTTNSVTVDTPGNNANLGNFVAIRIATHDIPKGIWERSSVITGPGYVYMGFAHLDSIAVQVGQQLTMGELIGMSGNTGVRPQSQPDDRAANAHLDLTMFFVPAGGVHDATPRNWGDFTGSDYNSFFGIAKTQSFYPADVIPRLPLEIDPFAIWSEAMQSCI